ncbi:hypothetical protein HPB49_022805 [Dermacentor silvarum]|uniref:Uncharacterized protein n=1 Tax=Dermacentor silvarum TaxID=543639 RepID=A0ACB8D8N5_DERSI|nr:hypothetical protein HPB49_022805 [Dermacentor silvarum]
MIYSAFWRDPVDGEDTGYYNSQIPMLAAMLKHWGAEKQISVEATAQSMGRLLSEKIQEVLKSKRWLEL